MGVTVLSFLSSLVSGFVCTVIAVALIATNDRLNMFNRYVPFAISATAAAVSFWFAWGYFKILIGTLDSRDAGEGYFRQAMPFLLAVLGVAVFYNYLLLSEQQENLQIETRVSSLESKIDLLDQRLNTDET